MYRGFKLKSFSIQNERESKELLEIGENIFSGDKAVCETNLREFMMANNSLDGGAITKSWFPQIEADVFLSHSHKDEKAVKLLAGWLYDSFKIRAFIDSCIWGYSATLLKIIDTAYCLNEDKQTYSYAKRNQTTSHVNMMLASAISMMIDKAECLIFLNTPNSIIPIESMTKTESPWLYYEVGISQTIRKKIPDRVLNEGVKTFSRKDYLEKALQIEYEVDLSHLNELNFEVLNSWLNSGTRRKESAALDVLYALSPEKKYSTALHG
jgi:hypothetical protein